MDSAGKTGSCKKKVPGLFNLIKNFFKRWLTKIFIYFFGLTTQQCRVSVPHPGIKPRPPAMEAWTHPLGHQGCPFRAFLEARPVLKWQAIVLWAAAGPASVPNRPQEVIPQLRRWRALHVRPGSSTSHASAHLLSPYPTLLLLNHFGRSPPGSPVPGILQARTLEWVAISFSNACKWKVKVKLFSHVRLLATPWTAAHQAPPSMGFSRQEYWSGVPLPSPPDPMRSVLSSSPSHQQEDAATDRVRTLSNIFKFSKVRGQIPGPAPFSPGLWHSDPDLWDCGKKVQETLPGKSVTWGPRVQLGLGHWQTLCPPVSHLPLLSLENFQRQKWKGWVRRATAAILPWILSWVWDEVPSRHPPKAHLEMKTLSPHQAGGTTVQALEDESRDSSFPRSPMLRSAREEQGDPTQH